MLSGEMIMFWRQEAPGMAKRTLSLVYQVTPNSSQFVKKYKSLAVEGMMMLGWLSFLDEYPKYVFSAA